MQGGGRRALLASVGRPLPAPTGGSPSGELLLALSSCQPLHARVVNLRHACHSGLCLSLKAPEGSPPSAEPPCLCTPQLGVLDAPGTRLLAVMGHVLRAPQSVLLLCVQGLATFPFFFPVWHKPFLPPQSYRLQVLEPCCLQAECVSSWLLAPQSFCLKPRLCPAGHQHGLGVEGAPLFASWQFCHPILLSGLRWARLPFQQGSWSVCQSAPPGDP